MTDQSNNTEDLCGSMRRHWRAGARPPEFQQAVRGDCPEATLFEFNAAADLVWAEIRGPLGA